MLNGIKLRIRNTYLRKTAGLRKGRIDSTDFTIISNNCWGGMIYESYGLQKDTPTVGMYFMAEEYVKFVSDLRRYTQECEMTFIKPEKAKHKDFYAMDKRFGEYPIAMVGDVEIALLHFHSKEEAYDKWGAALQKNSLG